MKGLWDCFFNKDTVLGSILTTVLFQQNYREISSFLEKSQWWSKTQLEEHQLTKLKKLLRHAYDNVPYYRKVFNTKGIQPHMIRSLEDLHMLPFLTKTIVKEQIPALKATNYPPTTFETISTGGTTGEPLTFYIERGVALTSYLGFLKSFLHQADCHFTDRYIFLVGNDVRWRYQLFGRILYLSSFSLTDKNLSVYVDKMKKHKPKFIIAYPSAITLLGRFMKKNNNSSVSTLKAIICSGETLYDWQREVLEQIYQCKVYAYYNQREQTVFAGTCGLSNFYHIYPQFGITELIGKDGKPVKKEGELGEIVGTGFMNFNFPFIRYRTGDIGMYTSEACSCGRHYQLLKNIEGRHQEFIVLKTGTIIPVTGIYGLIAHCSNQVKECQLYQEIPGEVVVRIQKDEGYTTKDENCIQNNFQKRFGSAISISLEYVDVFPRTMSGKHQFIIQKIPIDFNNLSLRHTG
jgi:phenylacetate-CoA ligase